MVVMERLAYIHIGKTAGTTIKDILRLNPGFADVVRYNNHKVKPSEVPESLKLFFCVRDPVARFVSGFYHRKGKLHRHRQESHDNQWSRAEKSALDAYTDVNDLVRDMASSQFWVRNRAMGRVDSIMHLGPGHYGSYWDWFGNSERLRNLAPRIGAVLRLESFESDLKKFLDENDLALDAIPTSRSRPKTIEYFPIENEQRSRLAGILVEEYRFLTTLREMGFLPPDYLEAESAQAEEMNMNSNGGLLPRLFRSALA